MCSVELIQIDSPTELIIPSRSSNPCHSAIIYSLGKLYTHVPLSLRSTV